MSTAVVTHDLSLVASDDRPDEPREVETRQFRAECSCGWNGRWESTNACMGVGHRHVAGKRRAAAKAAADTAAACTHKCSCTSDMECPHDCPCDGA